MTVHVFLSFDNDDSRLVELFRGQVKNDKLVLEFADYSLKDPINSQNAEYVKREIREKIRRSSAIICLVGRSTYRSRWVEWELETGHDMGKCLIGVRLHSDYGDIAPKPLINHGADVVDWNIRDIVDALGRC